ncbi:MAG TPA: hypothetical protein VGU70_18615 [Methylobacterium sp.]|jgi:hypothetical protein|nr:hypothetical protein [Methylobacterium sp.]
MKLPALLTAALLASCSSQDPSTAPSDNGTTKIAAQPSAPPAPAPQPQPATPPPLTPEGWGPLRIGMSLAEVTAALGPDADPEAVGGPDPESCDQFRPARAPNGMLVMIEDGRLTSISLIDDATILTDRGLGIGATAAEVRAVYGRVAQTEPHKYSASPAEYITVWAGGPRKAYAEDPAARGIRYEVEENGRVSQIHAGGPSIQYVEGCA